MTSVLVTYGGMDSSTGLLGPCLGAIDLGPHMLCFLGDIAYIPAYKSKNFGQFFALKVGDRLICRSENLLRKSAE